MFARTIYDHEIKIFKNGNDNMDKDTRFFEEINVMGSAQLGGDLAVTANTQNVGFFDSAVKHRWRY